MGPLPEGTSRDEFLINYVDIVNITAYKLLDDPPSPAFNVSGVVRCIRGKTQTIEFPSLR